MSTVQTNTATLEVSVWFDRDRKHLTLSRPDGSLVFEMRDGRSTKPSKKTETTSNQNDTQPDIVPVYHWHGTQYRGEEQADARFLMKRPTSVRSPVSCTLMCAPRWRHRDIVTASFEISNVPGGRTLYAGDAPAFQRQREGHDRVWW